MQNAASRLHIRWPLAYKALRALKEIHQAASRLYILWALDYNDAPSRLYTRRPLTM
jgi:hypothetical protein